MPPKRVSKFTVVVVIVACSASAVAAIVVWQLIESLETNSSKVHQYISKSKEYESQLAPAVSKSLRDTLPDAEIPAIEEPAKNQPECVKQFLEAEGKSNAGRTTEAIAGFTDVVQSQIAHPTKGLIPLRGIMLSHDKFMAAVYEARAICYDKQGKKKIAVADLDKAVALDPNNPGHIMLRARMNGTTSGAKLEKMDLDQLRGLVPKGETFGF